MEIIVLHRQGLFERAIPKKLGIQCKTVKKHIGSRLEKKNGI
jgi:DNA-binding NarL/FixJ family response regulator